MYEKCIKCERLGKDCIPNLYVMSVVEIRDWARKLKEEKGWTNAHLAEASGVPKGTIDSNFSKRSGKPADVNYSTFSPVLCTLIENNMNEMPCCKSSESAESDKQISERMLQLEKENAALRKSLGEMKERYNERNIEFENRITYFKEQIKYKQRIIAILIVISCILVSFIMLEIAVDWANSDIGFFWR